MNNVILIGRITKDIELRFTQSNKAVASFTLAVNRRRKEDGADFFSCVAWGTLAETMSRYVRKGSKIAVSGRLSERSYEKDGRKHYVTEVIADEVEFLDSKNEQKQPNDYEVLTTDDDLPF